MVGPVINVGHPGSSRYTVNWQPAAQGWSDFGRGLGDLGKSIQAARDKKQKTVQQQTLGELMAGDFSNEDIVNRATAAGVPVAETFQLLHARNRLKPDAPETFETVQDPYGRGGVGQRSSRSGAISGYQGPLKPDKPTERRIVKGNDGFNYYDDTKERVLPGVKAPPPKRETPKIADTMRLADEWQEATKPVRDLARQRDLMTIGLEAAAAGNMVAGSQAVLVTFQKILDPTSVVRESEYARSSSGLALIERVKGEFTKLREGGAGLTLNQLKSFAQLADDAVAKLSNGRVRDERERIGRFADHYGIDRSIIFSGNLGTGAPPAPPQQPAPTHQGNASDRFAGAPWQGPPQSAPVSILAAQAQSRPAPGAVRKDLFGTPGQPSGGRGAGDEFGTPFDASGLGPGAVQRDQFDSGRMPPSGSEAAPRQYTSPDPGQPRLGAAGLNDLNAPPAPDAQPGDLEQAVEYLLSMPEAEMSRLNFQTMTLTGLKALKIARQRRQQQTMAGDYTLQGQR